MHCISGQIVARAGDSTTAVMSQKAVSNLIDPQDVTEDITSLFTVAETGKYIYGGAVTTRSGAMYTNPVHFNKGETINVTCTGTNLTKYTPQILSYYDDESDTYITLYTNKQSTPVFSYTFQADYDVIFSLNGTTTVNATITRTIPAVDEDKMLPYKRYYNWTNYNIDTDAAKGDTIVPSAIVRTNVDFARKVHVECNEGDIFVLNISTSFTVYSRLIITDENLQIIQLNLDKSTIKDWRIVIPEGGKHLFASTSNSTTLTGWYLYKKCATDETPSDRDSVVVKPTMLGNSYPPGGDGFSISSVAVGDTFSFAKGSQGFPYTLDVREGDTYYLTDSSHLAAIALNYIVLDSQNRVIKKVWDTDWLHWANEFEITIPEGGAMLVFNGGSSASLTKKKTTDKIVLPNNSILSNIFARVISNASGGVSYRFCLSWASDTHLDIKRYKRWVDFTNKHQGFFDAALHTGDANRMSDTDKGYQLTVATFPVEHIPFMFVLGNHDSHGQTNGKEYMVSGSQLWNGENYCAPFFDASTVYAADKSNFYRDFTTKKIRLICLNDYDTPRWINGNWVTTTDDDEIASAVEWTSGTSYTVGTVVHFKGQYLRCAVAGVLLDNGTTYANSAGTIPRSRFDVKGVYWQQAKIDFFLSALNVESGWSIIIAAHCPPELLPNDSSKVISDWTYAKNSSIQSISVSFSQDGYIMQDIIAAYLGRTSINNAYHAINRTSNPLSGTTLINQTDYLPDVTVNADFSAAVGDIVCYLHGHQHCDSAFYMTHTGSYNVLSIGNINNCYKSMDTPKVWFSGDIIKGEDRDSFNVLSVDTTEKNVYILRVGANVTDSLSVRDYVRISYAHS